MFQDLLDHYLSLKLDVTKEEYIEKIESVTYSRAVFIIQSLLSDDDKRVEKGIKEFKTIK